MIGNPIPWGSKGWVILEEGRLNPQSMQLDVTHYLVIRPDGTQIEGVFNLEAAKEYILLQEPKAPENE